MEIILLERVHNLGQMGEVVRVRDGYARNFLIPKGKALRATKRSLADFEHRRAQLEAANLERRRDAEAAAGSIRGRSVVVIRQASESRQLYGSVSARDIATAFIESGVTFDRAQVRLDAPLKTLGIHEVAIALHPEVEVTVTVNIARSEEEAEIQAGRRTAPTEDEDEAGAEAAPDVTMPGAEQPDIPDDFFDEEPTEPR